jgi:hypothetical protein
MCSKPLPEPNERKGRYEALQRVRRRAGKWSSCFAAPYLEGFAFGKKVGAYFLPKAKSAIPKGPQSQRFCSFGGQQRRYAIPKVLLLRKGVTSLPLRAQREGVQIKDNIVCFPYSFALRSWAKRSRTSSLCLLRKQRDRPKGDEGSRLSC